MDLRTGHVYPSREAALMAGVPASDIVPYKDPNDPWRHERHAAPTPRLQGRRERLRRLRQLALLEPR